MLTLPTSTRRSQAGAALVITLAVLAVITLLVVGFAISMRVEQISAQTYTHSIIARQMTATAVDEALYLIKTNTPLMSTNAFWASQPGRILSLSRSSGGGGGGPSTPAYTNIVDDADANMGWIPNLSSWGLFGPDPSYYNNFTRFVNVEGYGADFKPTLPEAGNYEVYVWYKASPNRASNVMVRVWTPNQSAVPTDSTLNQKINGAPNWFLLGTYAFDAGEQKVGLRAIGTGTGYVIADAMMFVKPGTGGGGGGGGGGVVSGPSVLSSGGGADVDLNLTQSIIASNAAYVAATNREIRVNWINVGVPGATSPADEITDNAAGSPAVQVYGTWTNTTAAGNYASNQMDNRGIYTGPGQFIIFYATLPVSGVYSAQVWYTAATNRATNVPMDVNHAGGTTTIAVNQRNNGSQWYTLLVTNFNAGTASVVLRTDGTSGYVIADAVRFYKSPTPTFTTFGRYAFWVDDEAAKININRAQTRSSIVGATPRDIALDSLTGVGPVTASNSYNSAVATGYFTGEQWKDVVSASDYQANKFYVSPHGGQWAVTPWGAARINLNDATLLANPTNFVSAVTNVLTHAGWVNWFGQSFANKYPSNGVFQIAANIRDYVDADNFCTDSTNVWTDLSPPQYLGLENTPYLNELAVTNVLSIANLGGTNYVYTLTTATRFELWNMYATDFNPNPNAEIWFTNRPVIAVMNGGATVASFDLSAPATITAGAGLNSTLNSGAFSVVTHAQARSVTNASSVDRVVLPEVTVTAIYRNPSNRMDYAVIVLPTRTNAIAMPAPNTTNFYALSQMAAANDPRVKPISNNWIPLIHTNNVGTLGTSNTIYVATNGATVALLNYGVVTSNGTVVVVGDGDPSSVYIRNTGRIDGVGELGYIHTGQPWRTLRLQPRPAVETNSIPDWVVLDLFAVTNQVFDGRININAAITNIYGATTNTFRRRIAPLEAVIPTNMTYYGFGPNTDVSLIASNIYLQSWAVTNSAGWAVQRTNSPNNFPAGMYAMIGELCEIDKVSTNYTGATNDAMREARILSFANLVDVRSERFMVHVVGQSLNKLGGVMGEARAQAVIQREQDPGTDGILGTADDKLRHRVVNFRYLD